MAVTKTQFRAVFGTTSDAQFVKLAEWMDAILPKWDNTDPDNPVQVSNNLDDLAAHVRADLTAKYVHWKQDQTTVEF